MCRIFIFLDGSSELASKTSMFSFPKLPGGLISAQLNSATANSNSLPLPRRQEAAQQQQTRECCSTRATVEAQHPPHVVLQTLPLLSDLGFLTGLAKQASEKLLNKNVSGSPALAEALCPSCIVTRDKGRGSHSCLFLDKSSRQSGENNLFPDAPRPPERPYLSLQLCWEVLL